MVELLVRKWKLSNLKPNGDEASEETRMIETPIKQRRPGPSVKIEILVDDKSSSAAGKGKHWKESKRSVRHSLVKGAMRWAEAAAKALPGVEIAVGVVDECRTSLLSDIASAVLSNGLVAGKIFSSLTFADEGKERRISDAAVSFILSTYDEAKAKENRVLPFLFTHSEQAFIPVFTS
mmetsp:Transcript_494/g.997  ORF Transcript_494/g.997 Transcript_494/m.997 type:complete len:178 (+) Transcript_494:177-710(+)